MIDPTREPNPDSPPNEDDHGAIEQIDEAADHDAPDPSVDDPAPDAGNGAVGGTDGITKNQDDTAQ